MSKNAHTSAAYTTEFHHEFRVETGRLLRRRFLWFSGVVGAFGILSLAFGLVSVLFLREGASETARAATTSLRDPRFWALSVLWVAIYAASFLFALRQRPEDRVLLRLSFWLVAIDGLINVTMRTMELEGALGLGSFFITHMVACAFLPWTAWQALRPMVMVLAVNAGALLLVREPVWKVGHPTPDAIITLALSPLLAIPGTLWCWVRHSKRTQEFKYRFMTSRYSEMRRELVDARRIHESLFPEPIISRSLRLHFDYEPMRQIGGDFLYANHRAPRDDESAVSIVLLDVTGHGIPAALTVNRLHGEMERVFAENPDIGPGEVLTLLNRYVHLTLATHSIYLTAFCVRVDPRRAVIEYASGGHPPAFIRAVDGTIEDLTSTAFVLGACPDGAFDAAPRELRFGPGDTLIAYTDGAIEAKGPDGRMLRIEGLRRLVATIGRAEPDGWSTHLREQIASFRGGPPADDTLFLTLHRPVGTGSAPRPSGRSATAAAAEISA